MANTAAVLLDSMPPLRLHGHVPPGIQKAALLKMGHNLARRGGVSGRDAFAFKN